MEPIGIGRYLTDEESRQVGVLFAQIMPCDPVRGVPGADDTEATEYLSHMLALGAAEFYQIPAWQRAYRDGLLVLNDACVAPFQVAACGPRRRGGSRGP